MTLTEFKEKFAKCKPKIVTYRNYKIFSNESFRQEVLSTINNCSNKYNCFTNTTKEVINLHAPQKNTYIRETKYF